MPSTTVSTEPFRARYLRAAPGELVRVRSILGILAPDVRVRAADLAAAAAPVRTPTISVEWHLGNLVLRDADGNNVRAVAPVP